MQSPASMQAAVGAGISSMQTVATYVTGADIQTASTDTGGHLINLQTIISPAMSGNGEITTLPPIVLSNSGALISGKIKLAGNDTVKVETDTNNDGQIDLSSITTLTALNATVWQQ